MNGPSPATVAPLPAPLPSPAAARLPRPPGARFAGMGKFFANPLAGSVALMRAHGDVVRIPGIFRAYLISHPEHVQHVLRSRMKNYSKSSVLTNRSKLIFGENVVSSEGEFWVNRRRIVQPSFVHGEVTTFPPRMSTVTQTFLDEWDQARAAGRSLDLGREMRRLTLEILGRTLFRARMGERAGRIDAALVAMSIYLSNVRSLFLLPWLPLPRNNAFRRGYRELNIVCREIVEENQAQGFMDGDLISRLVQAKNPGGGEVTLTDDEIYNELKSLIIAGHETTASSLTQVFRLLLAHPAVLADVMAEVHEVLGGRVATPADLSRLVKLRRVIDETLRLHPPIWSTLRRAVAADELGGFAVPANTLVMVSFYTMHRHPAFWPDAEKFDPNRFLPDQVAARPDIAYKPFGAGPRACLGAQFSILEMLIVVAGVLQRFRLESVAAPAGGSPAAAAPWVRLHPA